MTRHAKLTGVTISVMVSLILGACGGSNGTEPSTDGSAADNPNEASGPVSISMWMWDEPGIGGYWQESVRQFEEKYDTTVDLRNLPVAEYRKQLVVEVTEGSPSDVMFVMYAKLGEVVAMGGLEPLDDILDPELIARIDPSALADVTYDGKIMAIPIASRNYGLLYNKQYFEEEGLTTPPTTPEEFLDYARKLQVKDGDRVTRYGAAIPNANDYPTYEMLLMLTRAFGGDLWSEAGEPTVNSPAAVKALAYYKTLYDEELIPRGKSQSDVRAMYANGTAAMEIDGAWQYPFIAGVSQEVYDNTVSAPVPMNNTVGTTNITIGVSAKAKNPQGAANFLNLVASPELLATFLDYADVIPQIDGGVPDDLFDTKPYLEPYVESLSEIRGPTPPFDEVYTEWEQILKDTIVATLQSGLDPQQQLDKAQVQVEALLVS